MSIDQHAQDRAWTFEALGELEAFLEDPDFEGSTEEEQLILERKRKELQDGKYRAVFLGAFNVGKSALVNAFLGDEYLPTVLEECTTKIAHIIKADAMRTVLDLSTEATEEEVQALTDFVDACGVGARVSAEGDGFAIAIDYAGSTAAELRKTLGALVTVAADVDYPRLRSLRGKFDEIFVYLPNDSLEDDVALVDSPGVHSISETNEKIAHEIIPNSHLVACLIDSHSAANEQNREFIERIVRHRHRKMFFVINKSDQLNPDEIDLQGRRGPAKDLCRSLAGIVDNPEIFFVSSLYALLSTLLAKGRIGLDDLDRNNKVKIPWSVQRDLMESEDPAAAVADYLAERSNVAALKERLLSYLYNENREGAILESVCRFLDAKAWALVKPIQIRLDMARENPRLDTLRAEREGLSVELDQQKKKGEEVLDAFNAMASGGQVDGAEYGGYGALVAGQLGKAAVEQNVLKPLRQWLGNDENVKEAKKTDFAPLAQEMESVLGAFMHSIGIEINREVDAVENYARGRTGKMLDEVPRSPKRIADALEIGIGSIRASLGGSYFAFTLVGALLGAGVGAGAWWGITTYTAVDIAALIGASGASSPWFVPGILGGAGAVLGAVLGMVTRASTSAGVLRDKLTQTVCDRVDQILQRGTRDSAGETVPAVRDQLEDLLDQRRKAFAKAIEAALDGDVAAIAEKIEAIQAEEEEIKRKQEEIIARLEPKAEMLSALGQQAREIADVNAPTEGL